MDHSHAIKTYNEPQAPRTRPIPLRTGRNLGHEVHACLSMQLGGDPQILGS